MRKRDWDNVGRINHHQTINTSLLFTVGGTWRKVGKKVGKKKTQIHGQDCVAQYHGFIFVWYREQIK